MDKASLPAPAADHLARVSAATLAWANMLLSLQQGQLELLLQTQRSILATQRDCVDRCICYLPGGSSIV